MVDHVLDRGVAQSEDEHRVANIARFFDLVSRYGEIAPVDRVPGFVGYLDLLIDAGWDGWWLLEASSKPPDRVQGILQQREIWDGIVAKSLHR